MYLMLSLLVAAGITLFVVSKIAKMLLAKRPGLEWVTVASIVSALIALFTYVTLTIYVVGLEPMMMLGITFAAMIVFSSIAFKVINKMSWGAAIATNVANVVIFVATSVAAVVINGESLSKVVNSIAHNAKSNTMMVDSMVNGSNNVSDTVEIGIPEEEMHEDDTSEPMTTELELLPEDVIEGEAQAEIKQKPITAAPKYQKQQKHQQKYQVVNIDNIKSLIGRSLKIHTNQGRVIVGQLKQVNGNDAMLYRRVNGGTAVTPVEFSSIKKLEVYR